MAVFVLRNGCEECYVRFAAGRIPLFLVYEDCDAVLAEFETAGID